MANENNKRKQILVDNIMQYDLADNQYMIYDLDVIFIYWHIICKLHVTIPRIVRIIFSRKTHIRGHPETMWTDFWTHKQRL